MNVMSIFIVIEKASLFSLLDADGRICVNQTISTKNVRTDIFT